MSSAAAAPRPHTKIEAHVWRIAAVVVLGTIMSVLDTTIVNVALDTLGKDLDASVDQIQWVVTGYLLALAAVIPVSGWASRRFSSRNVYIVLAGPLHRGLGALRARPVGRVAGRLPRDPGDRRRHAGADRPDDPGQGRRARATCRR